MKHTHLSILIAALVVVVGGSLQILGGAPQTAHAFTTDACYNCTSGTCVFYPGGDPAGCSYLAPYVDIIAVPLTVDYNTRTDIRWSIDDMDINGCTAYGPWPGMGGVYTGSVQSSPLTSNSTFSIICRNAAGNLLKQDSVSVTVNPPPPTCPADTPYTETDAPSIAQYCSAMGVTCGAGQVYVSSISCHTGGTGTWSSYGSACTSPNCTGCGCVAAPTQPAPTASLSASPTSVASGGRATLTWSSTNATSCTASGPWSNSGTLSGSGLTDALTSNTTFYFQCTGPGGTTALKSATVSITAASGGASCTLPWGGTTADGSSVTAYQSALVTSPATCTSQTRTCSNGTLSGTYTNQSCTVTASGGTDASGTIIAPNCTIAVGASSCSTTVDWSTSGVSSAQVFQSGVSFSTSLSGSRTRTVGYSSSSFTLFDRTPTPDVQLDGDNARGICASGSGWNGTYCELGYLPDLTAGAITPTTALVGQQVSLVATVSNIGPATTGSNFRNFIQVATAADGGGTITDLSNASMNTLAAGASNTTNKNYTFSTPGTYSARACTDKRDRNDSGQIDEVDEDNNCGWPWTNITVGSGAAGPTATLTANPTSIYPGASSRLTWSSTGATSCTAAGGFSTGNNTSGNTNVRPSVTSIYSVTCTGAGGTSAPAQATVTVLFPSLSIYATPNRVARGNSSTISWNATDVRNCSITKNGAAWRSNLSANGSNVVTGSSADTVNSQTTYVMSCTDVSGAAYGATATVLVNLAPSFEEF